MRTPSSLVAGVGLALMAALAMLGTATLPAPIGLAAMTGVAVLDVIVAAALYSVFKPVNRGLALIAAWLRVTYAAVLLSAIGQLAATGDMAAYSLTWTTGLILFGVHLGLLGWLGWISDWLPRPIGALLVIAGVGYLFDSVATIAGFTLNLTMVAFIGEVALLLWLLIKGRTVPA